MLADGTYTYLYGQGRIAQDDGADFDYFLGDALGSVRQLADETGEVTLARRYEPYGDVLESVGTGETSYGFTGENFDEVTGLLYLRARFYSGSLGRFTTRDTFAGFHNRPASLNPYVYTLSDPVNHTDPSGHCPPGTRVTLDGRCVPSDSDDQSLCELLPFLCQPSWDPLAAPDFGEFIYSICGVDTQTLFAPNPVLFAQAQSGSQGSSNANKGGIRKSPIGSIAEALAKLLPPGGKLAQDGFNRLCQNDGDCTNEVKSAVDLLRNSEGARISGNLAVARVQIGGFFREIWIRGSHLYSDVPGIGQPAILRVGTTQGLGHSERQILEPIARWLVANPGATGRIDLFTERTPCRESCRGLIMDFVSKFQDRINLVVYYSTEGVGH